MMLVNFAYYREMLEEIILNIDTLDFYLNFVNSNNSANLAVPFKNYIQ